MRTVLEVLEALALCNECLPAVAELAGSRWRPLKALRFSLVAVLVLYVVLLTAATFCRASLWRREIGVLVMRVVLAIEEFVPLASIHS